MEWEQIKCGQEWRNKRGGRHAIVEGEPSGPYDYVRLLHSTGRHGSVRVETFLQRYELRPNDQVER